MASIRGGVVAKVVIGSTRPLELWRWDHWIFCCFTSVGMFGGQAYGKMGESLYVYIHIYIYISYIYIYICIYISIYIHIHYVCKRTLYVSVEHSRYLGGLPFAGCWLALAGQQ